MNLPRSETASRAPSVRRSSVVVEEPLERGPGSPLDLHSEVSHSGRSRRCRRRSGMLLFGSNGRLVPVRCSSPNKCDYCAMLSAVEWSEMLALDAMERAPSVWMVLTTRGANPDPAAFYDARRLLMRAIKRRWPDAEYLCIVEFTTGYGPRSGGKRRPHWNVLLKGVPVEALAELEEIVRDRWTATVDAQPEAQFVGEVAEVGGLMRYLALHFLKESQRPPRGWRGHRVTASRGYFVRQRWVVRQEAQRGLRVKRELHRLDEAGLDPVEALAVAEAQVFANEQLRWELVIPTVDERTGEIRRLRPMRGGDLTVLRPVKALPAAAWSVEAQARGAAALARLAARLGDGTSGEPPDGSSGSPPRSVPTSVPVSEPQGSLVPSSALSAGVGRSSRGGRSRGRGRGRA